MGKKERAEDAKKQKEAAKKERRSEAAKADPALPALAVTVVMAIGVVVFSDIFFQSQAEGRMDGRWRASLGGSYDEQGRPPFVYDGSQAEGCSGHCGACRTRC